MNKAVLFLLAAATAMAADQGLLDLVMPEAKVLSGVQVDRSEASPFGQYVLSSIQADAGFNKFITATGFDPRRDLREILAASTGDASHSTLILARGAFQPAVIITAATVAGATVADYRGVRMLAGPHSKGVIAFLDSTTAAIGEQTAVQAAIDRRLVGASFSGPLAQKAQDVSSLNHAWFATVTPLPDLLGAGAQVQAGIRNLAQAVLQASGGLTFGADAVTLSSEAVTRSPQDAQALVDVLKLLAGMAQPASSAQFTADGATVRLTISLPEQQAEQLFRSRPARARKVAVGR
jgi:hypothetical protein